MNTVSITATIRPDQFARIERELGQFPGRAEKAVSRALNRALDNAKTRAVKALSANLGLPQRFFNELHRQSQTGGKKKAIIMDYANAERLEARMSLSSGRIPVIFFKARPSKPSIGLKKQMPIRALTKYGWATVTRRGTGVTWSIGRHGKTTAKQAFVGRGRAGRSASAEQQQSGHIGVFIRRKGAKRLKIDQLMGPSIGYVAQKDEALKRELDIDVSAVLARRIDHELDRLTKGR